MHGAHTDCDLQNRQKVLSHSVFNICSLSQNGTFYQIRIFGEFFCFFAMANWPQQVLSTLHDRCKFTSLSAPSLLTTMWPWRRASCRLSATAETSYPLLVNSSATLSRRRTAFNVLSTHIHTACSSRATRTCAACITVVIRTMRGPTFGPR